METVETSIPRARTLVAISTLASPLRNLSMTMSRCEPSMAAVKQATEWPSATMRRSISAAAARDYDELVSLRPIDGAGDEAGKDEN